MRKGVLLFAVIAFALTGGTIYFVNNWMKAERMRLAERSKKEELPQETGVFVLVASKALPAGHIITVADLRWQSWPDKALPQQYVVRQNAAVTDIPPTYVGTVVRRGIPASGPIIADNLIKIGDRGFLAAVLKPGSRAIAVRIDEATGVAGLVYPGDRVDLILIHEVSLKGREDDSGDKRMRVGETILSNVRIIAIDQSIEDLKSAKGAPRTPRTATIEVTPRQAELIAVASRMGTITLTLQSLACQGDVQAASAAPGEKPVCEETKTATADDAERGETFTADRDVSRAQRREGSTSSVEVYILRGTQAKETERASGVTVKLPPGTTVQQ